MCGDTSLVLSCGCGGAVGLCADTCAVVVCSCVLSPQQSLQCVAVLFSLGQFLSHPPQLLAQLFVVLLQGLTAEQSCSVCAHCGGWSGLTDAGDCW